MMPLITRPKACRTNLRAPPHCEVGCDLQATPYRETQHRLLFVVSGRRRHIETAMRSSDGSPRAPESDWSGTQVEGRQNPLLHDVEQHDQPQISSRDRADAWMGQRTGWTVGLSSVLCPASTHRQGPLVVSCGVGWRYLEMPVTLLTTSIWHQGEEHEMPSCWSQRCPWNATQERFALPHAVVQPAPPRTVSFTVGTGAANLRVPQRRSPQLVLALRSQQRLERHAQSTTVEHDPSLHVTLTANSMVQAHHLPLHTEHRDHSLIMCGCVSTRDSTHQIHNPHITRTGLTRTHATHTSLFISKCLAPSVSSHRPDQDTHTHTCRSNLTQSDPSPKKTRDTVLHDDHAEHFRYEMPELEMPLTLASSKKKLLRTCLDHDTQLR